ncbi:MAG: hypothetical protein QGI21_04395 [Candidatus Poseidoniaceae archaeon]|jgi:hypothetical protein|nr:hypothetical protein [Candidatus Poseidoniaceae archaeon]
MIRRNTSNQAQMLLATGVVLMMALLSMAIFGVKSAGLSMPYDDSGDSTIDASIEVTLALPGLAESRANIWYEGGLTELESVEKAMDSLHQDVLHHGEIRGVELKLLNITITEESGIVTVDCELGAADRNSMLSRSISFDLNLD